MSRPRTAYVVKAQRRVGLRWQTIERGQQPQRFAVYREERSMSRSGNLILSHKFIESFSNATLATVDAERRTKLLHPAPQRTLGQRFGAIGKVIAGSSESPFAKDERKP